MIFKAFRADERGVVLTQYLVVLGGFAVAAVGAGAVLVSGITGVSDQPIGYLATSGQARLVAPDVPDTPDTLPVYAPKAPSTGSGNEPAAGTDAGNGNTADNGTGNGTNNGSADGGNQPATGPATEPDAGTGPVAGNPPAGGGNANNEPVAAPEFTLVSVKLKGRTYYGTYRTIDGKTKVVKCATADCPATLP